MRMAVGGNGYRLSAIGFQQRDTLIKGGGYWNRQTGIVIVYERLLSRQPTADSR